MEKLGAVGIGWIVCGFLGWIIGAIRDRGMLEKGAGFSVIALIACLMTGPLALYHAFTWKPNNDGH